MPQKSNYIRLSIMLIAILGFYLAGCSDQDKNPSGLGAVQGKILDDKGVPVNDVSIKVYKNSTAWSSDKEGFFYLNDLKPGVNVVTLEKFGYQTWVGEVNVDDTRVTSDFTVRLKQMVRDLRFFYDTAGVLKISWVTPDKVETFIEYGLESNSYKWKIRDNNPSLDHELVLGSIDPAKTYYYRIGFNEFEKTPEALFRVDDFDMPKPVTLRQPSSVGTDSAALTWTQSLDSDFMEYRIYRSETQNVTSDSLFLGVSSVKDAAYFLDTGLAPGKTYYYRVYVRDTEGYLTGSNIVSIKTYSEPNLPPSSIVLNPAQTVDYQGFTLMWTKSFAADFYSYRIIVSELSVIDVSTPASSSTHIFEENNRDVQSKVYLGLKAGTDYYAKVFVLDRGGLSSSSNLITVTTDSAPDDPPLPVNLLEAMGTGPNQVRLSWTPSVDSDFDSYHIYYDTLPGVTRSSFLTKIIADKNNVSWFVSGLLDNRNYYFRVYVKDRGGNFTESNELSGKTLNAAPPAVDITSFSSVSGNSVTLNWTALTIYDFNAYLIYRSTSPGVDQTSTLLTVINIIDQNSYQDTSVNIGTTYYYRIFSRDDSGITTAGSEAYTSAINSTAMAGTLMNDMLWTSTNSPINIVGDVTVAAGVTLKIEKGVVLNFAVNSDSMAGGADAARAELIVNGTLEARGAAGEPVKFMSAGASMFAGDWGGIWFAPGSTDCVLENCEIAFARDYGVKCSSDAIIRHCAVYNNLFAGISVSNSSPRIIQSSIYSNSRGIDSAAGGNPKISSSNIVLNNVYAVSGGGCLGLTASTGLNPGTGGNYIAGNGTAGPNEIDMTGTAGPSGNEDGVMDTSSDTAPVQIFNVDIVKTAVNTQISSAGPE
jgi:fibronectin type 3 domain-containing protein